MLGEWISSCEMNTPRGIFEAYIMDERKITSGKGAATFLDVLGWKGIWERNQFARFAAKPP